MARTKSTRNLSLLSTGSVFIRNDAPCPRWIRFKYEECDGWRRLFDTNSLMLERTALENGWHFSYIASVLAFTAWGFTRQFALRRALAKVMEAVSRAGFNSFEVGGIRKASLPFLHSMRVTANPRHLSRGPFLGSNPRQYRHAAEEPEAIFWRAAEVDPQIRGI